MQPPHKGRLPSSIPASGSLLDCGSSASRGQLIAIAEPVVPRTYQPVVVLEATQCRVGALRPLGEFSNAPHRGDSASFAGNYVGGARALAGNLLGRRWHEGVSNCCPPLLLFLCRSLPRIDRMVRAPGEPVPSAA